MNQITNSLNSVGSVPESQGNDRVNSAPKEYSFVVKTALNLIDGSIKGYITYWITKILFDDTVKPRPYVLLGVCEGAIISTLSLVRIIGLKLLGDRSLYSSLNPQINEVEKQGTVGDRLRVRAWRVVSKWEGAAGRVDGIFARTFKVRTLQQINEKRISDLELTVAEIVRKAFLEQFESSFVNITARWGSLKVIGAIGYTLPGTNILLGIAILDLVNGCLSKIEGLLKAQHEERIKRKQAEKAEEQPRSQAESQPALVEGKGRFSRFRDWVTNRSGRQASVIA